MNGILAGVLAYILVQLVIGFIVSRRVKSSADYIVAGRRVGPLLGTFSMFATWFGAETCVGSAGRFYSEGMAGGATDPFGYSIALFLMGLVFAAPLWRRHLTTLADLFKQRFGGGVERFAALLMAPTSVFWAAGQIRAFGNVLHASSELNLLAAITLATGVVVIYTCSGGMLADIFTDFFQGIVLILGIILLFVILALHPDVSLFTQLKQVPAERLQIFGGPEISRWEVLELWSVTILGSIVAQELAARALASRSPNIARRSALQGSALYLAIGLIPAALGLIGPSLLPNLDSPETFLPALARQYLPTALYVLFVGALVSAILSTVDSTLLAASSLVTRNVLLPRFPNLTDKQRLLAARVGVVVFGLIAYVLALGSESVHDLVMQANGIGSAGILVLMIAALSRCRLGGPRAATTALILGLGVWVWGLWISPWLATISPWWEQHLGGEWTCSYVASLVAAVAGYLLVGIWERPSDHKGSLMS